MNVTKSNMKENLLDEMFERDWIICGTKEVVFDEFVKRISRGEAVKKEYMIEVVDKFSDGYPPVSTITPLSIDH
ncbi:hypothetical protein FRX31_035320 [Thalictrum thalictroides]|uniref:Uncharacterized protein n=1 Tax=Thalictrum thalictroides TaxID=46969 RepID=A0A7J6US53_THATH|nr:hypothetical protein FRX31_035320 [Thalictrum thalictroides]